MRATRNTDRDRGLRQGATEGAKIRGGRQESDGGGRKSTEGRDDDSGHNRVRRPLSSRLKKEQNAGSRRCDLGPGPVGEDTPGAQGTRQFS